MGRRVRSRIWRVIRLKCVDVVLRKLGVRGCFVVGDRMKQRSGSGFADSTPRTYRCFVWNI